MEKGTMLASVVIALLLVGGAAATTINLMDQNDKTVIGVKIDDLYYVVVMDGKNLEKVELNGQDKVDYLIETNREDLWEFMAVYPQLSKKERIQYINEHFTVPTELMLTLAGEYMKEQ